MNVLSVLSYLGGLYFCFVGFETGGAFHVLRTVRRAEVGLLLGRAEANPELTPATRSGTSRWSVCPLASSYASKKQ